MIFNGPGFYEKGELELELKTIITFISFGIGTGITFAGIFMKIGAMMKDLETAKGGIATMESKHNEDIKEVEKTIKDNKDSARKMVFGDDGLEKFARAEKMDEFQKEVRGFQREMKGFEQKTLLSLQAITTELKTMNKTMNKIISEK